jgi:hypothetical protein
MSGRRKGPRVVIARSPKGDVAIQGTWGVQRPLDPPGL